ncbi:MAG: oxygen-independent coproporphyrinogen III oxidase [Ferruginibacter sp.]
MEEVLKINPLLIRKYNLQLPKYTSYPPVSFWDNYLAPNLWSANFQKEFNNNNHTEGISIYIHLPFCESLCTYCGCNKKITTDHTIEDEYLLAIEKEWKLYRNLMQQTPVIREIHLGGGTPTFFSPRNLKRLVSLILKNSIVHPAHEFSVEGHSGHTTGKHLEILYSMGFRRISYSVVDIDIEIQRIINRIQPFEKVENAAKMAREAGFTSVNFELLYGLPKQTNQSFEKTIEQSLTLMPDRIAFEKYTHVPWAKKSQRLFDENDLPAVEEKIRMYTRGKEMLMQHGYVDIGMDQFTLAGDSLYKAWKKGKIHRNFMGYSAQNTGLLLGLGVSAFSDTGTALAQNIKSLHDYFASISNNQLAIKKGYILNEEDALFRKNILDISCRGKTSFGEKQSSLLEQYIFPKLALLAFDGLVSYDMAGLEVSRLGHFFIRNICNAFDIHSHRAKIISNKAV